MTEQWTLSALSVEKDYCEEKNIVNGKIILHNDRFEFFGSHNFVEMNIFFHENYGRPDSSTKMENARTSELKFSSHVKLTDLLKFNLTWPNWIGI